MTIVARMEIEKANPVTMIARVGGLGGAPIVQADVSTISYIVTDVLTATQTGSGTVVVSSAVFNSLQTDSRWTADAVGYNFLHSLPASCFPLGARRYLVEYTITPPAGPAYTAVVGEIVTVDRFGS